LKAPFEVIDKRVKTVADALRDGSTVLWPGSALSVSRLICPADWVSPVFPRLALSADCGCLREAHLYRPRRERCHAAGVSAIEMIPGMTLEKLQTVTEPKLQLASAWQAVAPLEARAA
jgi:hypothetical protein